MMISNELLQRWTNISTEVAFLSTKELTLRLNHNPESIFLPLLSAELPALFSALINHPHLEHLTLHWNYHHHTIILPCLITAISSLKNLRTLGFIFSNYGSQLSLSYNHQIQQLWYDLSTKLINKAPIQITLTSDIRINTTDLSWLSMLVEKLHKNIFTLHCRYYLPSGALMNVSETAGLQHWKRFDGVLNTCSHLTNITYSCLNLPIQYITPILNNLMVNLRTIGPHLKSFNLALNFQYDEFAEDLNPINDTKTSFLDVWQQMTKEARYLFQLDSFALKLDASSPKIFTIEEMNLISQLLLQLPKPEKLHQLTLIFDNMNLSDDKEQLYFHKILQSHRHLVRFIQSCIQLEHITLEGNLLPSYLQDQMSQFIIHHRDLKTINFRFNNTYYDLDIVNKTLSNPRLQRVNIEIEGLDYAMHHHHESPYSQVNNPSTNGEYVSQRPTESEQYKEFLQKIEQNTSITQLDLALIRDDDGEDIDLILLTSLLAGIAKNKTIMRLSLHIGLEDLRLDTIKESLFWSNVYETFEENLSLTSFIFWDAPPIYQDRLDQLSMRNQLQNETIDLPIFSQDTSSTEIMTAGSPTFNILSSWGFATSLSHDTRLFFFLAHTFNQCQLSKNKSQVVEKQTLLMNLISCLLDRISLKAKINIPNPIHVEIATYLTFKELHQVYKMNGGLFFRTLKNASLPLTHSSNKPLPSIKRSLSEQQPGPKRKSLRSCK